ncbi:hypothetical protein [Methanoplanus limicola]|uniref:hypothetical protein n=1 Tax=Methanoplanus limicola TaxID=2315 RepID=UPI00069406D1|nr:hypothetical protein [Methanoplanus limicola]
MAENSSDSLFSSDYHRWLKEEIARQNELLSTKQTTETSCGTMEYSLIGKGPVILAIHGTPGGYDQSLLLFDWITQKDSHCFLSAVRVTWELPLTPEKLRLSRLMHSLPCWTP